ncbi:MAG: phosphoribosylformylglycinamidine synthase subunit PurL [Acidobacteria bacterium]|nr:phosphoribosylformylglycinamidine synthase subunit PurL [Acidobacteriota bacterium]
MDLPDPARVAIIRPFWSRPLEQLIEPPSLPSPTSTHDIDASEYERIVELLGRTPNPLELALFTVMWSEHCSYKSSKMHLRRLPTRGEFVIQGPGENAGVIDVGDGWCAVFKIESHNHPSFIEPYQGAATGVGGILRDIFTMGARPVAALNSLRFGPLTDPRNRSLMSGVVRGVGDYGNCFGVPTVGGEVFFDECYSKNPLVNAFALGLVKRDSIFLGRADGVGNPVVYAGAKTGRDGIHGATMASAEFDDQALAKRPNVQVGDPFLEKLLLEACLEAMRSGAIVGIQDMGAAGLTCSTCEMGARAGTGIELDLDLVPTREHGLSAYEMMLSESQERMLMVVRDGREREVIEIFRKWDLDAVVVGRVTADGNLRVRHHGQTVAEVPNRLLTDDAPVYERPLSAPGEGLGSRFKSRLRRLPDWDEVIVSVLSAPNVCSREWVYQQYDQSVRTNTIAGPPGDAAVIRIKETRHALALTLDSAGTVSKLDPREGARRAVAESCRNLVCVGARPLAATNCLNFASPGRPEVMWALRETIEGMAEACRAFGTPITGGNVSLYNETEGQGIDPTPVIGMLGIVRDSPPLISSSFRKVGDLVLLLGRRRGELTLSVFAQAFGGGEGKLRPIDMAFEKRVQKLCLDLIERGLLESAHDCAEGGLAVALAESCFGVSGHRTQGVSVALTGDGKATTRRLAEWLFGEAPSRIVVSAGPACAEEVMALAAQASVPALVIGSVSDDRFSICYNGELLIDQAVGTLERAWRSQLDRVMSRGVL